MENSVTLKTGIMVLVITCAGFYALDHLVMLLQGLPLNWDLTPTK